MFFFWHLFFIKNYLNLKFCVSFCLKKHKFVILKMYIENYFYTDTTVSPYVMASSGSISYFKCQNDFIVQLIATIVILFFNFV